MKYPSSTVGLYDISGYQTRVDVEHIQEYAIQLLNVSPILWVTLKGIPNDTSYASP